MPWSIQRTSSTTSTHVVDASRKTRRTSPVRASASRTSFWFCSRLSCWMASVPASIQSSRARYVSRGSPGVCIQRVVATLGAHDADAHRGVDAAGLRVRDACDDGVERVGVVDEREDPDARGVELPVRDAAAVGAPAECVADAEFLFVDPVGRAVDRGVGAIGGERRDDAVGQALDVDVVGAHERHARRVGRELGEHQRRLGRVAAKLAQLSVGGVEHPVVAARVVAPDLARVGEDEQSLAVVRPGVVGDVERRRRARGREPGTRDDHASARLSRRRSGRCRSRCRTRSTMA